MAEDGAWTWFNDERAIFNDDVFYVSYVKSDGTTAMTAIGLDGESSLGEPNEFDLSTWKQKDDHNNAAFLALNGDEILTTYGTHGWHNAFYQRRLIVGDGGALILSDEEKFEVVDTRRGLTYQNLMRLEGEGGRIYNFFRGNNFNPNFVTSDDDAESWSDPTLLLFVGENSNQRPYVKYISNGVDRIDIFYTDGHPRKVHQNNVYHMYYKEGTFFDSNGKEIRTLEALESRPLVPEEGTLVFDGSQDSGRGWVWDLEYDQEGQPYGAFISSPSGKMGSDMRYWTARFENGEWVCEEIAYAGSNLYPQEEHYAGGIALDPNNDQQLIISADVNPETGEPLSGRVYQLFRGERQNGQWIWTQLTFDSVNDNLRPIIVRGFPEALFWFSGKYRDYRTYDSRVMASLGF